MEIYSPISEIMVSNPITINKKESLHRAKDIMRKNKFHHLPVVENGEVVGMLSHSDMLLFSKKKFVEYDNLIEKSRLNAFHVEDIMTTGVAKLSPDDYISTALHLFHENLFHAVPIVENEKLVGIVTTFDIIHKLLEKSNKSQQLT